MVYWFNNGFYDEKPHEESIELSNDQYNKIMEDLGNGGILKEDDNGVPFVEHTEEFNLNTLNNLRFKREVECFSVINRGQLWYNSLSEQQLLELKKWYEDWLNVTQTMESPSKPQWLN